MSYPRKEALAYKAHLGLSMAVPESLAPGDTFGFRRLEMSWAGRTRLEYEPGPHKSSSYISYIPYKLCIRIL